MLLIRLGFFVPEWVVCYSPSLCFVLQIDKRRAVGLENQMEKVFVVDGCSDDSTLVFIV